MFSVVELDGRAVAFHYGFEYGGALIWYKPSFDLSYSAQSPGLLLIRELIRDSLEQGREEVDFTIGGESFKSRFANAERSVDFVALYNSRRRFIAAQAEKALRHSGGVILRRLFGKPRSGSE